MWGRARCGAVGTYDRFQGPAGQLASAACTSAEGVLQPTIAGASRAATVNRAKSTRRVMLLARIGSPKASASLDGNSDLSLCAAAFQVAYGLGDLGERVCLAHEWSDVTGLDLLTQRFEVSLPMRRDVHGQPL
jgi:hypothetical protein